MLDNPEKAYNEMEEEQYGSYAESGTSDTGLNDNFIFDSEIELEIKDIPLKDITLSYYKKVSRVSTIQGLTGVVTEWGVVSPIHVLQLEDGTSYQLLSGLRRLFAAQRNSLKEIKAVVWKFSNAEEGKQKAMLLGAMIDRNEGYRSNELWEQMQLLEEAYNATPSFIEYLLGLHAGDAMKLKDVMLADPMYAEIKEKLMNNEFTIDGAYKKLTAERKKENRLEKEDGMTIDSDDDGEINVDDMPENTILAAEDVKELLELTNVEITDEEVDNINEIGKDGTVVEPPPTYDDKGERTKLPDDLRKEVYERDDFKCRCCGLGGKFRLPTLQVHHIIEVSQGGDNSLENLLTICMSCHTLLHTLAWGKLSVVVEDLDAQEREIFRIIIKYANVIIKAEKRLNNKGGATDDKDKRTNMFAMPGTGLSATQKAFNQVQAEKLEV